MNDIGAYANELETGVVAGRLESEQHLVDRFRNLARLCNKHGKKLLEYRKDCAVGIALAKGFVSR